MSAVQISEEFTVRVFLRHISTYCACTLAQIHVSTMLQDNVIQLSKLLLTSCQFCSARIPREYVVAVFD